MLTFENLIESSLRGFDFHRAKIPGGWILVMQWEGTSDARLCFIPDPGHNWDGSSLPQNAEGRRR